MNRTANPFKFSFKDGLGCYFLLLYTLVTIAFNFFKIGDTEVIRMLNENMKIILIGYFAHEGGQMVYKAYTDRKSPQVQEKEVVDFNDRI